MVVQLVTSVSELLCNTTSNVCEFQPLVGAACSSDTGCKNGLYDMLCLNNVCTIAYKNVCASCTQNGECVSNNCTSGACVAMQVGSPCNEASSCGTPDHSLFCNANLTCSATVSEGALCGMISGGIYTQCKPGLSCVGPSTNGTCMTSVGEGSKCSSIASSTTNIFLAPLCSSKDIALTCILGKCVARYTIPVGQACGTLPNVSAGGACDAATGACVNNTCVAYRNITCQSNSNCQNGICDCPNTSINGTCTISPVYPTTCRFENAKLLECVLSRNGQRALGVCNDLTKANRCCDRSNPNTVANTDINAYCGITQTPTPAQTTTSAPTTSSPVTTTTPTTTKSDATSAIVCMSLLLSSLLLM